MGSRRLLAAHRGESIRQVEQCPCSDRRQQRRAVEREEEDARAASSGCGPDVRAHIHRVVGYPDEAAKQTVYPRECWQHRCDALFRERDDTHESAALKGVHLEAGRQQRLQRRLLHLVVQEQRVGPAFVPHEVYAARHASTARLVANEASRKDLEICLQRALLPKH
eukprot:1965745-Prymnesium_polylepis.1